MSDEKRVALSFRLPETLVAKLKRAAKQKNKTATAIVEDALLYWLTGVRR